MKHFLIISSLAIIAGCTSVQNLNISLGSPPTQAIDLSLTQISSDEAKLIVCTANDKYLVIIPNYGDSSTVSFGHRNDIIAKLNSSYIIPLEDLPALTSTLQSIIDAYDQKTPEKTSRVINYVAFLETGRVITNNNYVHSISGLSGSSNTQSEIQTLFRIQFSNELTAGFQNRKIKISIDIFSFSPVLADVVAFQNDLRKATQ